MTHYSTERWIDFVNGLSAASEQKEMQKHLDSGCKPCMEAASLWRNVQRSAADESRFEPPAETVGVIKAAFGRAGLESKPGFSRILAELIFDSFRAAAVMGARAAGLRSRQMLFVASPFQIDVNIEVKTGKNCLSVTGQLMDTSQPDAVARGIPITLSNLRGDTVRTVTNDFGEFWGEIENRGDLELTFPGDGERPIVVSLRDALTCDSEPTRPGDKTIDTD